MKKIITYFLILSALYTQAQQEGLEAIPKGTKFIGGTISINFNGSATNYPDTDDAKSKTNSFSLGPVAGKYIRDNVSIGLGVNYNFSINKSEYTDGYDYESSNQSAGAFIFIRKNYKIVPNIFFFLQAQTGLSYGASKNIDSNDTETNYQNYGANLGGSPGFQIFLGEKLSLESTLGSVYYQFNQSKQEDSDVYTNNHYFVFSGGFSGVNFSVRYFIFK